jgi:predicted transcriptional regulator
MKKFVTFLLSTASIFALSAKQNLTNLTIEGKIAIYGNEPHTYIAIKDISNKKLYKIENAKDYNLQNLQNRVVKIKAIKLKESIGSIKPAVIKVVEITK